MPVCRKIDTNKSKQETRLATFTQLLYDTLIVCAANIHTTNIEEFIGHLLLVLPTVTVDESRTVTDWSTTCALTNDHTVGEVCTVMGVEFAKLFMLMHINSQREQVRLIFTL
jgi:ribosome-interacting GTPase 1